VTSFYTGNPELNTAFLGWFNDLVKERRPDAYLVGEAWTDAGAIAALYESGVDSFFNFPYAQVSGRLVAALNTGTGAGFAEDLAAWNRTIREIRPGAVDALFLSNHDHARSAGFLMRDPVRQKTAASMYLLAPGNPFIYYGEEIGMTGSGVDPNKRLPMVWSSDEPSGISAPPGATQTVTDVEGVEQQQKDRDSLLSHYRAVLRIKAENPEIARGEMAAIDTGQDGVAAFSCTWEGRTVVVLHNLTDRRLSVDRADLSVPVSAVSGYTVATGGKPRLTRDAVMLPPWSSTVLR
jgi:glycosidase